MKRIAIFDLETNGLLYEVSTIHCMVIFDVKEKQYWNYTNKDMDEGLAKLAEFDVLVGHNIIGFDVPVIRKLYPFVSLTDEVVDTLILSKLAYYNLMQLDLLTHSNKGRLPKKFHGRHSLEAWGYRLGDNKGDFGKQENAWEVFTPSMLDYCRQDVSLTVKLWKKLQSKSVPDEALKVEQDFAKVIQKQTENGWYFDVEKAQRLHVELMIEKEQIEADLKKVFKPKYLAKTGGTKTYKKEPFNRLGVAYYSHTPVVLTNFNPSSRQHIVKWLYDLYAWNPTKFTDKKSPIVDASVLNSLPYPEAQLLAKYFDLQKVVGMLSEGKNAWLKLVKEDDRIHGELDTLGAVTGRCTHRNPNLAQVPSGRAFKGKECRSLFTVPKGKKLIGCDASGLELRMLAHFMARYDKGAYGEQVLDGDIHTVNQKAAGLETRDQAKTFIYAFLYGAGDAKIGSIVGGKSKEGKALKDKFFKSLPALEKLITAVKKSASKGYIIGITGRKLYIRSEHSALNVLLQSAGAYVMKYYTIEIAKKLGDKIKLVGNIHDEVQCEVDESDVAYVSKVLEATFADVTSHLDFRIKLEGEANVGNNWEATH